MITAALVGVLLTVLGIINMHGNISTLHWYHRQRVTEADRKPFGKLVGLGTMLVGVAIIVFGVFYCIYELTQMMTLLVISTVLLIGGIVVGLGLSFYAMMKYNKGIF